MAVPLITTAGGPEQILRNYWREQLLDILKNNLIAADLMEKQTIPANRGNVIEFHRINSFPKQPAAQNQLLGWSNSTSLKGRSFTVDSVVYGLELITNDLVMSEQAIITAEPNPIPILSDRFLYNAKDTLDQWCINIMVSNTGNTATGTLPSVTYFGASTSPSVIWGDGSATLTEATLDADNPSHRVAAESFNSAYTTLRSQSALLRNGRYDALLSPEVCGDLRTDGTFQDIALKGDRRGEDKFEKAMVGDVFGVRVLESENVGTGNAGTIDATNDQLYRCPIVGVGYAARINHAKGIGVPRVNYIPPGKTDKSDPYGNVGIMTWKMYLADGGVLNPLCGVILKVASTRLKSVAQDDDKAWNT